MKGRFAQLIVTLGAFVTCAATFAQAPDPRPGATTPVQVMNKETNPVPVKVLGDIPIVGDVEITNTSPIPVTVIPPTRPFAKLLCLSSGVSACDAGFNTPALRDTFVVPTHTAGGETVKRLVIEFVSGQCVGTGRSTMVLLNGRPSGALVNPDTGDNFTNNRFPLSVAQFLQAAGINGAAGFAQPSRIYFDAGTTVSMTFDVVADGTLSCRAQLNGHFIVQ